jgi:DDE superfamily endonuclease
MSLLQESARVESLTVLSRFRTGFYDCLPARRDALFELTDAVLSTDGPVKALVDLTLVAEHRRGHGAMYDALNRGRLEPDRFRRMLAALPLPKAAGGRIVLAVDVSPWLRPDAPTSAERLFCHVYGRAKSTSQFIPGWPYSFVAALETGSPRPGCGAGFETFARRPPARPAHPNPASPAPDAHPARRTAAPHPTTTSARP